MLRTHYDSLKIARDAPIEVVRAAYRALSQKYHPDRHPTDPEATQLMALLNSAYEVLSDPEKRRLYDELIRSVESAPLRRQAGDRADRRPDWIGAPESPDSAGASRLLLALARFRHYWILYVVALFAIFAISLWYESWYLHRSKALVPLAPALSAAQPQSTAPQSTLDPQHASSAAAQKSSPPPQPASPSSAASQHTAPQEAAASSTADKSPPASARSAGGESKSVAKSGSSSSATHAPQAPPQKAAAHAPLTRKVPKASAGESDGEAYARPSVAPNGEPWPSTSDYLVGYAQLNANGLSQVVIDNSPNSFDVFVKIVSVAESAPKAVRTMFIAANDRFIVSNLRAGIYEIRYENLDSGTLLRSEAFALEDSAIASGTRYSTVTLRLHQLPDDSQNTYLLSKEEFGR